MKGLLVTVPVEEGQVQIRVNAHKGNLLLKVRWAPSDWKITITAAEDACVHTMNNSTAEARAQRFDNVAGNKVCPHN